QGAGSRGQGGRGQFPRRDGGRAHQSGEGPPAQEGRRAPTEGPDALTFTNGSCRVRRHPPITAQSRFEEDQTEWPLPFGAFSFTHLTRCQKRRGLTFCLWITVRWVPSRTVARARSVRQPSCLQKGESTFSIVLMIGLPLLK